MCIACNLPIGTSYSNEPSSESFDVPAGTFNGNAYTTDEWWPSPRYGADDLLGSGNELTQERTLEAFRLVNEGRTVSLARVLSNDSPTWGPSRLYHQVTLAHGTLEQNIIGPETNRISYFEEMVTQIYHIGTHLDGFAHIGINGVHYNGHKYGSFYTNTGVTKFGMETIRPWLCRGVFLNVAKVVGQEMLTEGFIITPEHLQAACDAANVELRPGDAVIFHTGYGALFDTDGERYNNQSPGIGWDAAHWLADRRPSLIGADNWAIEALPGDKPDFPFLIHQYLLTEMGTHLVENICTEMLLEEERSEFLFIMAPIRTKGSTGSMVNPLAVF